MVDKYIFRKHLKNITQRNNMEKRLKNGFSTDFEDKIYNQYYYEYLIKNYFNDKAIIFNKKIIDKDYFFKYF